jgi:hypothetical protein
MLELLKHRSSDQINQPIVQMLATLKDLVPRISSSDQAMYASSRALVSVFRMLCSAGGMTQRNKNTLNSLKSSGPMSKAWAISPCFA